MPLSNRNCLVKEHWKPPGILGRILMNIRDSANTDETQDMDEPESTVTHSSVTYMWKQYLNMKNVINVETYTVKLELDLSNGILKVPHPLNTRHLT